MRRQRWKNGVVPASRVKACLLSLTTLCRIYDSLAEATGGCVVPRGPHCSGFALRGCRCADPADSPTGPAALEPFPRPVPLGDMIEAVLHIWGIGHEDVDDEVLSRPLCLSCIVTATAFGDRTSWERTLTIARWSKKRHHTMINP